MQRSSSSMTGSHPTTELSLPETARPRLGSTWETADGRHLHALSFWSSMSTRLSKALPSNPSGYLEAFQSVITRERDQADTEDTTGNSIIQDTSFEAVATIQELREYLFSILEDLFGLFIRDLEPFNLPYEVLAYRRKTVFRLPRLDRFVDYGLSHIQKCLTPVCSDAKNNISKGCPSSLFSSHLCRKNVYKFLEHPTRLFVLLELAFILEVVPHHRDFIKTLGTIQAHEYSEPNITPLPVRHPFSLIPLENAPVGAPVFNDQTSAFIYALFYPLQEVFQNTTPDLFVGSQFIERCLILFCLYRVPPTAVLKNYIQELIPTLINVIGEDNEYAADAAHRIFGSVLKFFNRDFEFGEAYIHIATAMYSQVLHAVNSSLRPWNTVVTVKAANRATDHLNSGTSGLSISSYSRDKNDVNTDHEHPLVCVDNDESSSSKVTTFEPHYWFARLWDRALDFLLLPDGMALKPSRHSLEILMEVPLIMMSLMQLNQKLLRFHAPAIIERLMQFLTYLEPHKNYSFLHRELRAGRVPPPTLQLLDFNVHRDLLDCHFKTLAIITHFLRAQGQSDQQQPGVLATCLSELSTCLYEILKIAPYQLGLSARTRPVVCVGQPRIEPVSGCPKLDGFIDPDQEYCKSLFGRREAIVSFRQISASKEYQYAPLSGSLSRSLDYRLYLGSGIEPLDYLKHYAVQLRVELINQLRASDSLQRHLVADVSFSRTMRSELHSLIVRELTDLLERRMQYVTAVERQKRLAYIASWSRLKLRETDCPETPSKSEFPQLISVQQECQQRMATNQQQESSQPRSASSPESINAEGTDTPNSSPDVSQQKTPQADHQPLNHTTWSYGELRMLLLSKYDCQDTHRALLFGTDRAIPMSILAKLCHTLCSDLHDQNLPISSQTVCVRALLVLIEWVDKLAQGLRPRSSTVPSPPQQQSRYIDQKEAADILRRVLESTSSKIQQLRRDLPQYIANCRIAHRSDSDEPSPDLFAFPRQAAWASPPLGSVTNGCSNLGPRITVVDLMKEIRIITRHLSQCVRSSAFLLTVVGVNSSPDVFIKDPSDILRLQNAHPLHEYDYQAVRNATIDLLHIAIIYGGALSRNISASLSSSLPLTQSPLGIPTNDSGVSTRGITGYIDRLAKSQPCASVFIPQGMAPGSTTAHQMAVRGVRPGLYSELQLNQIQSEQKEIIESSAMILINLHPANTRFFLSAELPIIMRLTEIDPTLYAFIHCLSQQTATVDILLRALVPILTPSLSLLTDSIALSCIRLPVHLGIAASAIHKVQYQPSPALSSIKQEKQATYASSIPPEDPTPKRQCLDGRKVSGAVYEYGDRKQDSSTTGPSTFHQNHEAPAIGQFLLDFPEVSGVHSQLSKYLNSPYLPLHLFEPSFSSYCPSIDVVDIDIDWEDGDHLEIPKWNQVKGIELHRRESASLSNTSASSIAQKGKNRRRYLDRYYMTPVLMDVTTDGPSALCHPTCRHQLIERIGHHPHLNYCEPPVDGLPSSTSDELLDQSKQQFFYLPRASSLLEISRKAIYIHRNSALYDSIDSVIITSDPSKEESIPDLSTIKLIGGSVGISPRITAQPMHGYPYSKCLAWDHTLITSEVVCPHSSDYFFLNNRNASSRRQFIKPSLHQWPYWGGDDIFGSCNLESASCSEKNPSLQYDKSLVTDFALIEGIIPGVDTLTHTASGIPRRTLSQTILRLWKITLTLICHFPDALPASGRYVEELVVNIISMVTVSTNSTALLTLLKHLFRSVQAKSTDGSDWQGASPSVGSNLNHYSSLSLTSSSIPIFLREMRPVAEWALSMCGALVNMNHPLKNLLSEVMLLVPVSWPNILPLIHLLSPALCSALDSFDPELIIQALKILESAVESSALQTGVPILSSTSQNDYVFGCRPPLICKLFSLMQLPQQDNSYPRKLLEGILPRAMRDPTDNSLKFRNERIGSLGHRNSICSFICRLLGKAGGKSRIFINEIPRFSVYPHPSEQLSIGVPLTDSISNYSESASLPLLALPLLDGIEFAVATIQSQRQSEWISLHKSSPSVTSYTSIATENFQFQEAQSQFDRLSSKNLIQFPFIHAFPYSHIYSLHESKVPEFEFTPPWHLIFPESFARTKSSSAAKYDPSTSKPTSISSTLTTSSQEVPLIIGTSPFWNFDEIDQHSSSSSYYSSHSVFPSNNPAIIQSIHSSSLHRWVKSQSFEFLSRTLVELLDLRTPFKEAVEVVEQLKIASVHPSLATSTGAPDVPSYYRRSPEVSRILRLIVKGLLYAATDIDYAIRRLSQPYLRGTADVFIGLLSIDSKFLSLSHLKIGNQLPPIDPMEFVAALTKAIDLEKWAISCLAIQVITHIAYTCAQISCPSRVLTFEFIRPAVQLCYSDSFTIAAGGAWLLLELIRIFSQNWALQHFTSISCALLGIIRSNRSPSIHLQVRSDTLFEFPLNQTTIIASGLAHDALSLLCMSVIRDSRDTKFLTTVAVDLQQQQPPIFLFGSKQLFVIRKFILSQLLPDLLHSKEAARENAMRLIERLSIILHIPLASLLLLSLEKELISQHGYCMVVLNPNILSTSSEVISNSTANTLSSTNTFDLTSDAIFNQPTDFDLTLLGQVLLRIALKSSLVPASRSRSAILDVLAWLTGLHNPHIAFTESFLLRVAILTQAFNSITRGAFSSPLTQSFDDDSDASPIVPSLIRRELEASEINKGLRVVKLIALHPNASIELPLDQDGLPLTLVAPRKTTNVKTVTETDLLSDTVSDSTLQTATTYDITDEVIDEEELNKRQELLSSCVGRITDIPSPVKELLIELGHPVPPSIEKPLILSVSILLHAYRSLNPHISRAAGHAVGVVSRHEAKKRREALVQSQPQISAAPIALADIFHPLIISSSLAEAFTTVALTHCRSPIHFQSLARSMHLLHPHLPSGSSIPTKLTNLVYSLCDGCDTLRHQRGWPPSQPTQLNKLPPFLPFSPLLNVTDVVSVSSALIATLAAVPPLSQTGRHLPRTVLRLIAGLSDFIGFGFHRHPNSHPTFLNQANSHSTTEIKNPSPLSWLMETFGARGDAIEQFDEALVDFCVAHAEELADALFAPCETQTDHQGRQTLPPCFIRTRMAVVAIKASAHPRAAPFRTALSHRIEIISRVCKDVVEILYPWAVFELPPSSTSMNNTVQLLQSQFNGEVSVPPAHDPLGWRAETLPPIIPDLMELVSILAQYDPKLFINDWIAISREVSSVAEGQHFHLLPSWIDSEPPWNSSSKHPLIHGILDLWVTSQSSMLQAPFTPMLDEALEKEEAYLSAMKQWSGITTSTDTPSGMSNTSVMQQAQTNQVAQANATSSISSQGISRSTNDLPLPPQTNPNDPIGLSHSLITTLGNRGGVLSIDSFHAMHHQPVVKIMASVLITFLQTTTDQMTDNSWLKGHLIVLRLKIIVSLCIVVALPSAQDTGYIDRYIQLWFSQLESDEAQHYQTTLPSESENVIVANKSDDELNEGCQQYCRVFSREEKKLLIRLFFRFFLYNSGIPGALKFSMSQRIIVPILMSLTKQHQSLLPDAEFQHYFDELSCLTPTPPERETTNSFEGSTLGEASSNEILEGVANYFEMTLHRRGRLKNEQLSRISIADINEYPELQIEALRLLRFLSKLKKDQPPLMPELIRGQDNLPARASGLTKERSELFWRLCTSDSFVVRHWSFYYIATALKAPHRLRQLGKSQPPDLYELMKFIVVSLQCPEAETKPLYRHTLDALMSSEIYSGAYDLANDVIHPLYNNIVSIEGAIPFFNVLQSLSSIITTHQEKFFQSRSTIVPLCTIALGRVALSPSHDTRRLILNLLMTLTTWELRHHLSQPHPVNFFHRSSSCTTLETFVYYAMKAALTNAADVSNTSRALTALTRCLLLCPSTELRFPSLLKCLQLPPSRVPMPKETPQHIAAKRSNSVRLSLVALAMFDVLVGLQDQQSLLSNLDLLIQSMDLLWGTTDVTVIVTIQSLVSKIIQLIPPPPISDLGILAATQITAQHKQSEMFWIRIAQVISCGLSLLSSQPEQRWTTTSTQSSSSTLQFLIIRQSPDSSGLASAVIDGSRIPDTRVEQRKAMNILLEALEKQNSNLESGRPTGIMVDPFLSCRLLFALTAADVHVTPTMGKGDTGISSPSSRSKTGSRHSQFSRHFICAGFGLQILTALSTLKRLLAICKPNKMTSANGQVLWKSAAQHPLILPNDVHRTLQSDSYECRVQLCSELLHLGSVLFLCHHQSLPSDDLLTTDINNNKALDTTEPQLVSQCSELSQTISQFSEPSITPPLSTTSGQLDAFLRLGSIPDLRNLWEDYVRHVSQLYNKKYVNNINGPRCLLLIQQNLLLTLIEIPQKLDIFALSYNCLKILGIIMCGPCYEPYNSFRKSSLYKYWIEMNEHYEELLPFQCRFGIRLAKKIEVNTEDEFDAFQYDRWYSGQCSSRSLNHSISSYETYDHLDSKLSFDDKLWIEKLVQKNKESYNCITENASNGTDCEDSLNSSLNTWSDVWSYVSLHRQRSFMERSLDEILFDLYCPPDETIFGPLQCSEVLNEWLTYFVSHEIPEMHIFFFDLVSRLLNSASPKQIPANSSSPSSTIENAFSGVHCVSLPLSSASHSFNQHSQNTTAHLSQIAGSRLSRELFGGMIGLWVVEPGEIFEMIREKLTRTATTTLKNETSAKVTSFTSGHFDSCVPDWTLPFNQMALEHKILIQENAHYVNLFKVLIMGCLSSHPIVAERSLTELVKPLPLCPKRRLLFILRRPELSSFSKFPLSRLLTQLILSAVPLNVASYSHTACPKFPSLSQYCHLSLVDSRYQNETDVSQTLLAYLRSKCNERDLGRVLQYSNSPIGEISTTTAFSSICSTGETKVSEEDSRKTTKRLVDSQSEAQQSDLIAKWSSRALLHLSELYKTGKTPYSWVQPLLRLVSLNHNLSSSILISIIPAVWKLLDESERLVLSDAIVAVLAKGTRDEEKIVPGFETAGTSPTGPLDLLQSDATLQLLQIRYHGTRVSTSFPPIEELPLPLSCGLFTTSRGKLTPAPSTLQTKEHTTNETATEACRMAMQMISNDRSHQLARPLLEAVARCHPPIVLPPLLLHYVATTFNCWHLVTYQLLHQLLSLSAGTKLLQSEHANVLADIYESLGETDHSIGLMALLCSSTETRAALADAAAGRWATSQDALNELFKKVIEVAQTDIIEAREIMAAQGLARLKIAGSSTVQSILRNPDKESTPDGLSVSTLVADLGIKIESPEDIGHLRTVNQSLKSELSAWASDWIRASTQLNQWNSLDMISSCSNVPLTQESKAKLQSWSGVEQLVASNDLLTPQAAIGLFYSSLTRLQHQLLPQSQQQPGWSTSGTTTPQMTTSLTTASDDVMHARTIQKHVEIMEELLIACQRTIVANWRDLPPITTAAHLRPLLFTQLQVETTEGFRWIAEFLKKVVLNINVPSGQNLSSMALIDSRPLVMTWRTRVLSKADDMRAWSDLLVWRNCFFTACQGLVSSCPKISQTDQNTWTSYGGDVAWTILKFAHIANSPHRLPEVALALLSKLHAIQGFFTTPVYRSDYLSTVTKCVKLCQTPAQLVAAMNLLRSIDVSSSVSSVPSHPKSIQDRALTINPLDKLKAELFVAKARLITKFPNLQQVPTDLSSTATPQSSPSASRYLMSVVHNVLEGGAGGTSGGAQDLKQPSPSSSTAGLAWSGNNSTFVTPVPFTGSSFNRPNNIQDALAELSVAIDICPMLASPWAAWAILADRVFTNPSPTSSGTTSKQPDLSQGVSAIIGYLMAAYLSPHKSRHYISRALWLLIYDDESRTLSRTFGRYADILPPSLWIPWIPQLLSSLEHTEALQAYGILGRLIEFYPQFIYYDLRAAFMEKAGLVLQHVSSKKIVKGVLSLGHIEHTDLGKDSDDLMMAERPSSADSFPKDSCLGGDESNEAPITSPSSNNTKVVLPCILQAEELLHQLFVEAFSGRSAAICLEMDVLADRITQMCLPSRLEEICKNVKILLAFLIEVPISLASPGESSNVSPSLSHSPLNVNPTQASQPGMLTDTPMPHQLKKFLIDKILLKCVQLLEVQLDNKSDCTEVEGLEKRLLKGLWNELSNDFGSSDDWKSMVNLLANEACTTMPLSIIDSCCTSISVETGIAVCKKWGDKLDSILERLIVKRLDLLDRLFITIMDPYQTSRQLENGCPGSDTTTLFVPGSINKLLFHSSIFASSNSFVITKNHLVGLELQRIRVSRGTSIPGNQSGRISQGGLTSNGCSVRLLFDAANGVTYSFIVDCCSALQQRAEQRTTHLLGILNELLVNGKEARRRAVNFYVPIEVPLHSYLRLVSSSDTSTTLHAIWNDYSTLPDPNMPELIYRRLLRDRIAKWLAIRQDKQDRIKSRKSTSHATYPDADMEKQESSPALGPTDKTFCSVSATASSRLGAINATVPVPRDSVLKATKDTFNDLCVLVSEDILKCYMHNCFPDIEHLHIQTTRITKDLAAWSLMCYALLMTDVSASRISIDLSTSRLRILGLRPTLKSDTLMLLDNTERVPFRLTRNLLSFIGPLGKSSLIPSVFYAILDCFSQGKNEITLRTLISLTLRDDLWSLNTYKTVSRQVCQPVETNETKLNDAKQGDARGTKLELLARQTSDESISDNSPQQVSSTLGLSSVCLPEFGLFNGSPALLCTTDLQLIRALSQLSWIRQALGHHRHDTVISDDLTELVLSNIPDDDSANHSSRSSSSSITGDPITGIKKSTLTANNQRRERLRLTTTHNTKSGGGLTIGQIRDKAERNTRKIIDRLGHLFNVSTPVKVEQSVISASDKYTTKVENGQSATPALQNQQQKVSLLTKIHELIENAVKPSNVALMPPGWSPWL